MKKVQDKKFLKFVKNTIDDLIKTLPLTNEMIMYLKEIYNEKELTIINVQSLYIIIETRKENMEYIKSIQDLGTFKIINKEHKYMESFINKYFKYEKLLSGLETISIKDI